MSIMAGIKKALESADSGLQELIDEVVTHADELEEDASERMYAGMYGEEYSSDISSADIDDDDEDEEEVPVTQSDADPLTDEEDEPMLLKQRNEIDAEQSLESLLADLESDCSCDDAQECDECDDEGHITDDLGEDTPDAAGTDGDPDPDNDEADECCESSLESLLSSVCDPWMSVANEACDCPADSGCRIADVSDAEDMEPGDKDDEEPIEPIEPDETVTRDELHPEEETTESSLESLLASLAMEAESDDKDDDKDSDDDEDDKDSDDDSDKDDSKDDDDKDDNKDSDDEDDDDSDDEKEESAEESLLALINNL